jgi:carbamoyltransferase
MLRFVSVRNDKRHIVPAIVHEDGTSRVQTVPDDLNEELSTFAKLLLEFYEQTGIPILLNTSLNGGGQPIFSNVDQCLQFYQSSLMDAICIGNKLLIK